MADRTSYGYFAEYYARFNYSEETVKEAGCPCGRPFSRKYYPCSFLGKLIRPPLYGYTKGWLAKVSRYYEDRAKVRAEACSLLEQGLKYEERKLVAW